MIVKFRVFGEAIPQGSMKAFMRKGARFPVVTSDNTRLKPWRQLVADGASRAVAQLPPDERRLLLEGVRVTVAFYLPRPKSLPKRVTAHTKAPDADKLCRGIFDALTAVVFRDDSQVCELVAAKYYAPIGQPAWADITVETTAGVRGITVPPVPLPLFAGAVE